jgi:hypothetical protein
VRSRWFIAALLLRIVTALALLLMPTVAVHEGYGPASPDGNGRPSTH